MSRIAAIVPMRHFSERVPGKNYRPLAGKPLYQHIIETLLSVEEIDEVVIDTDSPVVMEDAQAKFPSVRIVERPAHLRDGSIPMNDVLLNTLASVDAELILQTHTTNPFLSAETIGRAIDVYRASSAVDSVFGVTRVQARLWTANSCPINHDPSVLLRTQDLEPVFVENSCFYIFPRTTLTASRNRLGAKPLMVEVPARESIDIDEEWDFELAEAVASRVMVKQP